MDDLQEIQEYMRTIENRLIYALVDEDYSRISIKEFYRCFDIYPPKAEFPELIREINKSGNEKSKSLLEDMLPPGTSKSIEDFLAYEVPRELLNICYEELNIQEEVLQKEYLEIQRKPLLVNQINAFLLSTVAKVYDGFLRFKSGGFEGAETPSQKQILQKLLDNGRQELKKRFKEEVPQELLYVYLAGFITELKFNQKVEYFKSLKSQGEDIRKALGLKEEL